MKKYTESQREEIISSLNARGIDTSSLSECLQGEILIIKIDKVRGEPVKPYLAAVESWKIDEANGRKIGN